MTQAAEQNTSRVNGGSRPGLAPCDRPEPCDSPFNSRGGPIDLAHLARQTGGDRALARSVLDMLAQQIATAEVALGELPACERGPLAHRLKGAALNIGAFALARAAADYEADPRDGARREALCEALAATRAFAATLT